MIPYAKHEITPDDERAVLDALRSPCITRGEYTKRFEAALAEFTGAKHVVACSSGTMALWMACRADVDGGYAVVPANTFVATRNACLEAYCLAPHVADINWKTWLIEPRSWSRADTIIPVDYAGLPCDYRRLRELNPGATIIVDACHSLGARYHSMRLGAVPDVDMVCYSFHPTKLITTGEGGAVTTNCDETAERLRALRDNGRPLGAAGLNCHMSELSAALGLSQMRRAGHRLAERASLAGLYRRYLQGMPGLRLQEQPEWARSANHIMPVWLDPKVYRVEQVAKAMLARGIETRRMYKPLESRPNAEWFWRGVLVLPLFVPMGVSSVGAVKLICDELRAAMEGAKVEK